MIKNFEAEPKPLELKEQVNRISKKTGEPFYRYHISVNPKLVEDLGWKPKQKLKARVEGKTDHKEGIAY